MKLLCAIDFSELTPWVVETATGLAEGREGATIILLHVSPPAVEVERTDMSQEELQDLFDARMVSERKRLERHARDLGDVGIDCQVLLVAGQVVETILKLARKERPDMIVLGARNKSVVREPALGSVSRHVVRSARIPVVVVPPKMAS